ncbi:MAG: hypothetical protein R3231_07510 [bacterium]|nr:hypothetical protein [bacterium]
MFAELKPLWTKSNMEKAMVVVLSMVLLFVLKARFYGGQATIPSPAPGAVVSAAPVSVRPAAVQPSMGVSGSTVKEVEAPLTGQRNETLQASMKRDLFTPLSAIYEAKKRREEEADLWEPELQAILFDTTDPMAIINNQVVAVGTAIDKFEVIHIGTQEVVLSQGGSKRVLTIDKE